MTKHDQGIGYDVAAFTCISVAIICLGIGFMLGFALGILA